MEAEAKVGRVSPNSAKKGFVASGRSSKASNSSKGSSSKNGKESSGSGKFSKLKPGKRRTSGEHVGAGKWFLPRPTRRNNSY